jgi:O-acetyl-ADP-ribose deacetylase (regulator of RNase III)
MMIKFISLNKEWVECMKGYFKDTPFVIFDCCDITKIPKDNACFVSPANSLGFMDGGIDLPLSRTIMPGIESKVKRRIRELNILSSIGRHYLPIGSVITVSHDSNTHLIVAPTMFLPHDVRGTQNAYWSFFAAVKMWHKMCNQNNNRYNLIVTSHCCGCGKMSAQESAEQMKRAYDDHIQGKGPEIVKEFEDAILFPNRDLSQPNNYDNREIKELYMTQQEYLALMNLNKS